MLDGRRWIFWITIAFIVSGIRALRADPRMIRSKYVCGYSNMHLDCSPPTVLEIHAADFGGSKATICGNSEDSYQSCKLMDKTNTVKTRCDGKRQCHITALPAIFGDPCEGLDSQAHTSIYLNVMYACVKPINTGTPSEITPTQPSTASTGIATVEDKSTNVTSNTTSPMNLTTTANITRATTKEPIRKTELNTRTEGEGPATQEAIPVFDPAKSVDLEAISGTASLRSSIVIFVIIWVCISIAVISD